MATRTESLEFQTVRGKFAVICDCISVPDVEKFASELLQGNLISYAGHQTAIAAFSSPTNKIAQLVSEAANSVSNSPDNFHNFVSILESRNTQLASALRRDYLKPNDPKKEVDFVTSLRQVYRAAQPPTWDPLPQCQYVKLAMIKKKGKRCGSDKTIAESRVEGDVDKMLTIKVPVDSDKIFDAGTFDDERQVILVEGVGGMGKTSLAYQYAKKWAEGKLSTFDAVALVRLRDLNEHDVREVDRILPHLLFLASGNSMSKEMAQLTINEQKILLILDGWDESPASIRNKKDMFLRDLLRSVSPLTRILITSRPDFSLDLHGLSNRVEILGFTKSDIRDYFESAIKSQLPSDSEVRSACDKLTSHFHRYPVIESCCYVPLNAAILAYIYLNRDENLPVTRCELFQELVLCCIVCELETRQPHRVLKNVSSFEDLPADIKEQLYNLSELAFKGVMENKIVFTQKELVSISALGLLHSVQGFGSIGKKLVTCNFIHLAAQELLAAYYITRLEPAEHCALFETLLNDKLKFPVLQFYAGLTGLTNESVRNLITGFCLDSDDEKSRRSLLALLNCIFEAQIDDELFFERMVNTLQVRVNFSHISLSPIDCQAVHYFLSSVKTLVRGQVYLDISFCSIDDQCLGLLLGVSDELDQPSSTADSVLDTVKVLEMDYNEYTNAGIFYIAKAFVSNDTLTRLAVGGVGVTDMGLVPLLEALERQNSMKDIDLVWEVSNPMASLKKIGEWAGKTSTLEILLLYPHSPVFPSEEELKEWIQSFIVGGNSLIHSLDSCGVFILGIFFVWQKTSFPIDEDGIKAQLCSSLKETITQVNLKRSLRKIRIIGLKIFG